MARQAKTVRAWAIVDVDGKLAFNCYGHYEVYRHKVSATTAADEDCCERVIEVRIVPVRPKAKRRAAKGGR